MTVVRLGEVAKPVVNDGSNRVMTIDRLAGKQIYTRVQQFWDADVFVNARHSFRVMLVVHCQQLQSVLDIVLVAFQEVVKDLCTFELLGRFVFANLALDDFVGQCFAVNRAENLHVHRIAFESVAQILEQLQVFGRVDGRLIEPAENRKQLGAKVLLGLFVDFESFLQLLELAAEVVAVLVAGPF